MQRALIRFDPFLRKTVKRASLILPYTHEAGTAPHLRGPSRVVTHVGVEQSAHRTRPAPEPAAPLHIVTGGRLVHWKGQDLVIQALSRLLQERPRSARLTVTGEGPARSHLEQLTLDQDVADAVDFVGYLPTAEDVLDLIASCDLYALPTWRDGPPVAILEAMSVGTPVLCLAVGATQELVPDGLGLKVQAFPVESVADRIAETLVWALDHREQLREQGKLAAEHASSHHDWNAIGSQIADIYNEVRPARGPLQDR